MGKSQFGMKRQGTKFIGQAKFGTKCMGQNDRGRSKRDEINVGRSECSVVYGTKSNGCRLSPVRVWN
jgi:hypothetical protein